MRLIDADALAAEILDTYGSDAGSEDVNVIYGMVINAPTVDAEPARHGKWLHPEEDDEDYNTVSCSCSVCGWKFNYYEDDIDGAPYCAVCGAKMDIVSPLYQREGAEP